MSMTRRQWLLACGAAGMSGIGAALLARKFLPRDSDGGRTLRTLSLPDLNGKMQPFSQWHDKILVANFWATWCEPCRDEIPALVAAQKKYGKTVQIVGISVDSVDKIREFIPQFHINYPLVIADLSTMDLMRNLGNKSGGLPYTVIIDLKGKSVLKHLGALTSQQLDTELGKWGV